MAPSRASYAILPPLPLLRKLLRYSLLTLSPEGDGYVLACLQPDFPCLQVPPVLRQRAFPISPPFSFRYSSTFAGESFARDIRLEIATARVKEMSDQRPEALQRVAELSHQLAVASRELAATSQQEEELLAQMVQLRAEA